MQEWLEEAGLHWHRRSHPLGPPSLSWTGASTQPVKRPPFLAKVPRYGSSSLLDALGSVAMFADQSDEVSPRECFIHTGELPTVIGLPHIKRHIR